MFQAFQNRNIAFLYGAQVVSIAGDLVMFVALPFWVYPAHRLCDRNRHHVRGAYHSAALV